MEFGKDHPISICLKEVHHMESWDLLRELDNLRREVDEAFRGAGFNRPFGSFSRKLRFPAE
jgi:hypothetical protein